MGSQKSLELRARDLHDHSTSIPTPVSSAPSTPTFPSLKRKFEEEPPYLDLSDPILENKLESGYTRNILRSSRSPQESFYTERLPQPSLRADRSGPDMSFLKQPLNYVFDKIASFTEEIWNQIKPPQASSHNHAEPDSSQSPTQGPTPESTPEPSPDTTPEPISEPALDHKVSVLKKYSLDLPSSKPNTNADGAQKKSNDDRSKAKALATLAETLARRDAPRKKLRGTWPLKAPSQTKNHHRVRTANISGSPYVSYRPRVEDHRRLQRQRLSRADPQFEEARKTRRQDLESLDAYIATITPKKNEFQRWELLSKERADREEEIRRLRELQRKLLEDPIVKPLSDATLAQVRKIVTDRHKGKVLIENNKARVMIYVDDMWRLNPFPPANDAVIDSSHTLWLNDAIIDLYLYMVAERANANSEIKKVHAVNTFFWTLLRKNGPKKVENVTRKAKIGGDNFLRLHLLLIPVNFDNTHWALGVIKPAEKRIEFYDSWKGGAHARGQLFFQVIRPYLINELKGKTKIDKPWDEWWGEWKDHFIKDCPAQNNAHDCGVFTCKHAEVIARGRELSFTQADMPTIRYRMVAELMKGELGVE